MVVVRREGCRSFRRRIDRNSTHEPAVHEPAAHAAAAHAAAAYERKKTLTFSCTSNRRKRPTKENSAHRATRSNECDNPEYVEHVEHVGYVESVEYTDGLSSQATCIAYLQVVAHLGRIGAQARGDFARLCHVKEAKLLRAAKIRAFGRLRMSRPVSG